MIHAKRQLMAFLCIGLPFVVTLLSPILLCSTTVDESTILSQQERIQQQQRHRYDQWRGQNMQQQQQSRRLQHRRQQQQQFQPSPLELDRVTVDDKIDGADGVNRGWADSYSVGDECFCDTTYDHDIGDVMVRSPLFDEEISIRDVCEILIGPGPGNFEFEPRPAYNDIQCGNGPPNNAGDENTCPGRVEHGKSGCSSIGPVWNWKEAFPYDPIELKDGNELKSLLDFTYFVNGELLTVNALIDVRSESEFNKGHIENATLLANLADFKFSTMMNSDNAVVTGTDESIANPIEIIGCQYCNLVVYSQSVENSRMAIDVLRRSGFKGYLINGLGINQWTDAGHELVQTQSIVPYCASVSSRDSIVCTESWLQYKMNRNTAEQPTISPTLPLPPPTLSPTKTRTEPSNRTKYVRFDQPSYVPFDQPLLIPAGQASLRRKSKPSSSGGASVNPPSHTPMSYLSNIPPAAPAFILQQTDPSQ